MSRETYILVKGVSVERYGDAINRLYGVNRVGGLMENTGDFNREPPKSEHVHAY